MTPAAAARLVFTSTWLMATASPALPSASCEPPLKPNHPSQRMKTPSVTARILEGGVGLTEPSRRNFPSRGPTTRMPASAAQPPVLWTMVEPAKSLNPISASQPPPQVQAPTTGYMTAVRTSVNMKKRPHLDPLGESAGDDGGGGRHEDHLEEPVGHRR